MEVHLYSALHTLIEVRILQRKRESASTHVLHFFSDYSDCKLVCTIMQPNWCLRMGKRKITNEGNLDQMLLPSKNDVLGVAVKMLGADRIMVKCQDGKDRLCRIRGKLKRRVWIRDGDIVLVSPWDFQSDERGDIFWRYRQNQVAWLRDRKYLTL
jgi:translation initiation factor 1A